jgi:hypothetical protein
MLITLTNASPAHKNRPIVLNTDIIASIHRNITTREDGSIEEVTFIHCPPHGTWEVVETIEEVLAIASGEPVKKARKKA